MQFISGNGLIKIITGSFEKIAIFVLGSSFKGPYFCCRSVDIHWAPMYDGTALRYQK
jgi:hypothetical protein